MKGYLENEHWGRVEARKRYNDTGMVGANRQNAIKDGGSEMVHKYPDTARDPKLMVQDTPRDCLEVGCDGKKYVEPVKRIK